jgi:MFS family permease
MSSSLNDSTPAPADADLQASPGGSPARGAWRAWVDVPMLALLAGVLVYVAATTVTLIFTASVRVPFWDQWWSVLPAQDASQLFAQHNEHRIPVARVFFALDTWLLRGRGWLNQAITLCFLLGTAALLGHAARRASGSWRAGLLVFTAGAALLLGSYSWENLLWPFQISFVGVFPAAIGAFVALARPEPGRAPMLLAGACAAIATYSIANGVLVPPLLIVLAILVGRRRHAVTFTWLTIVLLLSYLAGYESPPGHDDPPAPRDPARIAGYVAAYFGGPFTWRFGDDRLLAAQVLGAVAIAAWLGVCSHALARRRTMPKAAWVPVFTMTFLVGTALLTALGRTSLGVESAFASRYGTPVLTFWTACLAYAVACTRAALLRAAAGTVACAGAIAMASEQADHASIGTSLMRDRTRDAETAFLSGGLEREAVDRVSFSAPLVTQALPELRRRRLSVFADPWADWLGKPLREFVPDRDDQACVGRLERARAVPAYEGPAFRVEGWVGSPGGTPGRVVVIDAGGTVVGFATTGRWRPDVRGAVAGIDDPSTGFVGHVGALGQHAAEVQAVALMSSGRVACYLDGSATLEDASSATAPADAP